MPTLVQHGFIFGLILFGAKLPWSKIYGVEVSSAKAAAPNVRFSAFNAVCKDL